MADETVEVVADAQVVADAAPAPAEQPAPEPAPAADPAPEVPTDLSAGSAETPAVMADGPAIVPTVFAIDMDVVPPPPITSPLANVSLNDDVIDKDTVVDDAFLAGFNAGLAKAYRLIANDDPYVARPILDLKP